MKPMARLIFDRWDEYCRQKYSEDYYNNHILEVEAVLAKDLTFCIMSVEDQLIARCIALGHDLLEDTDATEAEMRQYVCQEVITGINLLTKRSWERYEDYIHRSMLCGDERIILVKQADMYDHIINKKNTLTDKLKKKYDPVLPYLARTKRYEDE